MRRDSFLQFGKSILRLSSGLLRAILFCLLICMWFVYPVFGATRYSSPDIKVDNYNGSPTLFVSGKPEFPMFLYRNEIGERGAALFRQAGFIFYSSIKARGVIALGWTGDKQFDFTVIDNLLKRFAERVPDGYYMPRIYVNAPTW